MKKSLVAISTQGLLKQTALQVEVYTERFLCIVFLPSEPPL